MMKMKASPTAGPTKRDSTRYVDMYILQLPSLLHFIGVSTGTLYRLTRARTHSLPIVTREAAKIVLTYTAPGPCFSLPKQKVPP